MSAALAQNEAILAALRAVVRLPESIVSLKITMGIEQLPVFEIVHHPELEVTHLDSKAREYRIGDTPVMRRYTLVESVE
jgi:hypothetical protein